jgi:Family of unknown function (DUF6064)
MSDWWTYRPEDFLLFSPRVYWRLFELHNQAIWPLQIPALLLGTAILIWVVRPRPWSHRIISGILTAAWAFVAWAFLWNRYATINWAASYAVPVFFVQALLLVWLGVLRDRLRFAAARDAPGIVGSALFVYGLAVHPLVVKLGDRPIQAAEVFGIAPDPTAIATLGLLASASPQGAAWLLLVVPAAWCLVSWATLHAMDAWEGWLPLAAVGLAATGRLWLLSRRAFSTS